VTGMVENGDFFVLLVALSSDWLSIDPEIG